jgi:ribokinase
VFGSANLDTSLRVRALPQPGETVSASKTIVGPGGKGANQAAAIARTGVPVALLAAVGSDGAGTELLAALDGFGIDTSRVVQHDRVTTGRAYVTVDGEGENAIVISPGANALISEAYAHEVADVLSRADVLVVQGEVPVDATREAMRLANAYGTRIVANPAPYVEFGDLTHLADPLVLNSVEASQLLGVQVGDAGSIRLHAERLATQARSILVTLGAVGAVLVRGGQVIEFSARPTATVLDTTGAGDAFVGVLAAALASGCDVERACEAAVEAGTRTVETVGAAASYPSFVLPATVAGETA